MRAVLLLVLSIACAVPAAAADRRIVSPDGRHVVFLREIRGKPLAGCAADNSDGPPLELWIANRDGSGARKLVATHSVQDVSATICAFDNLQFDSKGGRLYFETPAWATSGAIHFVDLATGRERFFLAGNSLSVLSHCKDPHYRDTLIVSQHRYFVFSGSYDWSFLFSPQGKEIGPIGDGDFSNDVEDACG